MTNPFATVSAAIAPDMHVADICHMNASFSGEVTTLPIKAFRLIVENQFRYTIDEVNDDPSVMDDVGADKLVAMTTKVAIVFENKATGQSDLTLEIEVSGYCNSERDAYALPQYMLLQLASINSHEAHGKHTHQISLIIQYRRYSATN